MREVDKLMGRKLSSVSVNDLVSVPDRVMFPGRRNPYEWENGIVTAIGINAKGQKLAKVRVRRDFTRKVYEKWFLSSVLERPSYHHRVGEETEFMAWARAGV